MKNKLHRLTRGVYAVLALALGAVLALPTLSGSVFAYGQVTTRSIEMSSSNPGDSSVSYLVTFTPASATTIQAIAVDFCSNDPIIGDSCTAPTGFSVGTPTVSVGSISGETGGTWTASSANTNRTLELSNGSATGTPSGATTFTLSTAVNPSSAAGSFYARIFTFSSTANLTTWASTANGSATATVLDAGGIALSTAAIINVTAKVQETLAFCVYKTSCSDDPSFTIGHAVGSATIIDSSAVDTATTNFSLSTNAQSGATVRLKGDTLKSGGNSIAAAGAAAVAFSAGTADFGVRVSTSGTNITPQSPYNGAANNYGLDISTGGENITTTYGDQLATLSGATNGSISTLTWGATASNTTPAGTYTAAEMLIATGTF